MTQDEQLPITRAVGTVRLASDFVLAAGLQDLNRTPPSMVTYFLLGHALELAFKSILIAHGTSERTLRNLGHDLIAVVKAATKVLPPGALHLDEHDHARLVGLAPFYRAKHFEYVEPGFKSLPLARDLFDLTQRLVQEIDPVVDRLVRKSLATRRAV